MKITFNLFAGLLFLQSCHSPSPKFEYPKNVANGEALMNLQTRQTVSSSISNSLYDHEIITEYAPFAGESNQANNLKGPITGSPSRTQENQMDKDNRMDYEFLVGVEFSQENQEFSKANPYLRFTNDTRLLDFPISANKMLCQIHTTVDATLASVPVLEPKNNGNEEDKFITSKKSFIGTGSIYFAVYNPEHKVGNKHLFFGPAVTCGLQSLTEKSNSGNSHPDDPTGTFWGAGLKIGQINCRTYNSIPSSFFSIYYGAYENLGRKKFTIEGILRTGDKSGFFVGLKAILGTEGDRNGDDIRVYLGMSIDLKKIAEAITPLLPDLSQ